MDFEPSDEGKSLQRELERFMENEYYPNEQQLMETIEATDPAEEPPLLTALKDKARSIGLWNLFLVSELGGPGLTNLEYAPLCEVMGRGLVAARIFNCHAPDTGNMEILAEFGTAEHKERFLKPLMDGESRSCFAMTEPEVSGADPTGLQTTAKLDGVEYVINGHKWFATGALGARFAIVMAVTQPDAPPHLRMSQILVPAETPGFNILRPVSVMGHVGGPAAHCEIRFEDCRVPVSNVLGQDGAGFIIAQARLGPGRIHHCMRAIGGAQRAYEIMVHHAAHRRAFGSTIGEKQFVQEFIASSKLGALGVSDDSPLALMWRFGRMLRIADGPDEVHKMVIARRELRKYA
jgi:acyl-CoA dehydrogenase